MPSMANIVVKKNDGTTDVTYTAMAPSSGDGVPAIWRDEAGGTAAAFKPSVTLSTRFNGPKTVRRVTASYLRPQTYTDSTTSLVSVQNTIPASFTMALPVSCPQTVIDEAVSQFANLLNSTLFKDAIKAGFAPT